jgi:hypothetical protein
MSNGLFTRANEIVVEDGLEALEITALQEGAGDSAVPTTAVTGVALLGSARGVILARPSAAGGATTYDLKVFYYIDTTAVTGWFALDSAVLAALTEHRIETVRCGSSIKRVFIQVLNSDGNVDVYFGRTVR